MNIYTEMHHMDLYNSLSLLFEKRLGHQLFRPIGKEWFDNGFWKIAEPYHNDPGTIDQYLGINSMPKDNYPPLNDLVEPQEGIYNFQDKHNNSSNKAITFNKFKEMKFDIIIATIPEHIEPYKKLIREYQPQAKLIFQVGNIFWDKTTDFSQIPNLLSSTTPYNVPDTCNAVFYHQEFDLSIFKPQDKLLVRKITSFINCLGQTGWGSQYYILKYMLPEYEFKSYGGSCDDGVVNTTLEMANIMNESYFGFHAKMYGDGFGHVIHNWFACGVPVITHISDYKDKLGGLLLEDGVTCIDLDQHSLEEACDIIRNIHPDKYIYMRQETYKRFKEVVDYDKEETQIKEFLTKLK